MIIPEIKEAWSNYCTLLGNGLADIGNSIIDGGKTAWRYSKAQVKLATAAVTEFIVIAKADAKIRTVVRRNSRQRYWTATVKPDYVDLGRPLTYLKAVKEVQAGRSVFTVTWYEAKAIAQEAGGKSGHNNKNLIPEVGKNGVMGYYWHYHTYNRKGGHVFYLF